LDDYKATTHVPSCLDRLRAIYLALSSLYTRPHNQPHNGGWLGRTWIRQEVYGARELVVQCGSDQISWFQYLHAMDMMKDIAPLLKDGSIIPWNHLAHIRSLLREARRNTEGGPGVSKTPRDLVEVLLQSREFEFTEPKDTFYAILGMCNVVAFTKPMEEQAQYPDDAVLVDYSKSLAEVFHDAARCILHRKESTENLADMWGFYKRSSLHENGLPSWAPDWLDRRTGNFSLSGSGLESESPVWCHWPVPMKSDPSVLHLKARVLNYVAYLTAYTYVPDRRFGIQGFTNSHQRQLDITGQSIHCKKMQCEPGADYTLVHPHPDWVMFDSKIHVWRLAILGVGNDCQLCLVPSTTKTGDLVVAVAPNTPAMVISPKNGDGTLGGLIPLDDPYDNLAESPRRACGLSRRILRFLYLIFLGALLVSMFVFFAAIAVNYAELHKPDSVTATIIVWCCGATIAPLLVGYVFTSYPLVFRVTHHRTRAVAMSVLLSLMSNASYLGVAINLTVAERSRMPLLVFYCITTTVLVTNFVLRIQRKVNCSMEIAFRRQEVFEVLDSVAEKLGKDYEFCGPVAGFEYSRCLLDWGRSRSLRVPGLRWCVFRIAVLANNCAKDRPRLGPDDFDWFFSDVYIDRLHERLSIWDRPTQEFMLH
jgi:hypothetical protein